MLLAVCSSIPARPPKDIKDDIFILRQRASAILQSKEGMPLWDCDRAWQSEVKMCSEINAPSTTDAAAGVRGRLLSGSKSGAQQLFVGEKLFDLEASNQLIEHGFCQRVAFADVRDNDEKIRISDAPRQISCFCRSPHPDDFSVSYLFDTTGLAYHPISELPQRRHRFGSARHDIPRLIKEARS
jgi:hypothetical protein